MTSELLKVPFSYNLPFHLNKNGFLEWFNNQQIEIDFNNAIALFYALKTLNTKNVNLGTKLLILHKINSILPNISNYLVKEFIEKSFPLHDKAANCATLISGFYSELSKGYHLIIKSDEFLANNTVDSQQKIKIIYDGLYALNNEILSFSLSYCPVETGFWQKTYDLFMLANELGLAQTKIDIQGHSVEDVFKCILAFYLSNPSQFNPDELLIISKLINNYSQYNNLLTQLPEKRFKGLPAIMMNEDKPPAFFDLAQAYEKSILYVATANLAAQILECLTNKIKSETLTHYPLSRISTQRLVRSLSLNSRRKFDRESTDIYCSVIVGLYDLCKFLSANKNASVANVFSLQPLSDSLEVLQNGVINRVAKNNYDSSIKNYDLSISSLSENKRTMDKYSVRNETNNTAKNKIVDISKTGFGIVLSDPGTKLRNMDLIGVFDKDFSLLGIGSVRRISFINNLLKLGIEILATEVCCIYLSTLLIDEDNKAEGILLKSQNNSNDAEVIILPKIDIKINDRLIIEKNNDGKKYYKVLFILNKTKNYLHLKLAVDGY